MTYGTRVVCETMLSLVGHTSGVTTHVMPETSAGPRVAVLVGHISGVTTHVMPEPMTVGPGYDLPRGGNFPIRGTCGIMLPLVRLWAASIK